MMTMTYPIFTDLGRKISSVSLSASDAAWEGLYLISAHLCYDRTRCSSHDSFISSDRPGTPPLLLLAFVLTLESYTSEGITTNNNIIIPVIIIYFQLRRKRRIKI